MKADFTQIKKTTDLVAVVENYGIALKREGKDWRGRCPFHADENRPNFIVSPAKGLWRCPVCDVAGNVIQFVARMENLTEREAALKLLGTVPGVSRASEMETAPKKPECIVDEVTRAKLLARVMGFYAKTLHKDRVGLDYLRTRGLADAVALETFQVGYCNGSMRNALPKEGEIIDQLKSIGVLNEKGNEVFYKRVVVPIFDGMGNVVSLYGRHISDEESKHRLIKGEKRGIFNAAAAKTHQALILVESTFDALSLWIAGFRNVIALRGKDGWKEEHSAWLAQNGVREIYVAFDNDNAGKSAVEALRTLLSEQPLGVYVIQWPEGIKDANAFFSSRNATDFTALLKAANPEQPESNSPPPESEMELTADGFAICFNERRYQLYAIEKPSASRLKATVKAVANADRFVIDTLDFYSMRSKRSFIAEAGRLFNQSVDVIETDVNRLILATESYVAQKAASAVNNTTTVISETECREGMKLARNPDLMGELQRDMEKLGIIGERTNRLLLYLAMTSRKMDDPLAVQILSSSGAGKSHLQDAVLSLCPEEDLIKLTTLSDRALFYKGEDSLRHKAIAISEVAGAEGARYALRNLISDKKLTSETTVKNMVSGRLETQVNVVYGPSAVFETTTQPDTDPETKSRYWLLSVDESPEQTRAIMEWQRQSHTLEGRKRRAAREAVFLRHHAFQRLLRPIMVINPYEPLLAYGDGRLSFRRDQPKYLNLILAVTFLHQHQRAVKHDPELGEYIETTLDDIAFANQLGMELFGQSLDELSSPGRELLRLIGDYVSSRATENPDEPVEWTRRELREAIHWSEARLRLHLGELMRMEYIAAVSGRFGSRFLYRLMVEPGQIERHLSVNLKDVASLQKEAALAGLNGNLTDFSPNLATQNPNLASENGNLARGNPNLVATSQPPFCEVLNGSNPHKHRVNGVSGANLAGQNGKRIYVLRKDSVVKTVQVAAQ